MNMKNVIMKILANRGMNSFLRSVPNARMAMVHAPIMDPTIKKSIIRKMSKMRNINPIINSIFSRFVNRMFMIDIRE